MNRQLLEQPFGHEEIKHRDGSFGQILAYVPGHTVIQRRLNQHLKAVVIRDHSSTRSTRMRSFVIGKLTAEGIVKRLSSAAAELPVQGKQVKSFPLAR